MDRLMTGDLTLLIVDLKKSSRLTVGVPHHTPGGRSFMPTLKKRPGDENAGFLGELLAEKLQASFVCACNYFLDPNKSLDTDYSRAIIRSNPKVLVEVHGHGHRNTDNDVEISCGSKKEEIYAVQLMDQLKERLKADHMPPKLKELKIEARFDRIYFRATGAATIKKPVWRAYHIETPQFLRLAEDGPDVPEEGKIFIKLLAETLEKILGMEFGGK